MAYLIGMETNTGNYTIVAKDDKIYRKQGTEIQELRLVGVFPQHELHRRNFRKEVSLNPDNLIQGNVIMAKNGSREAMMLEGRVGVYMRLDEENPETWL